MRVLFCSLMLLAQPLMAEEIWLGATTTLRDSGFLDAILPIYEAQSGDEVVVLAQSTGQIIQSAKDGNVDLLLTHHQAFEQAFIDDGYGDERFEIMASKFVLIGPKSDPAQIRDRDMDEAFQAIAHDKPIFITRGDASGTYEREMEIWQRNEIHDLDFRTETGQGMGATLNIASAMDGYVLSEIASFLQFQNKGRLEVLTDNGEGLENIYAVTTLNPEKFAKRNLDGAQRLAEFFGSDAARQAIDQFEIDGVTPFTTQFGSRNEELP